MIRKIYLLSLVMALALVVAGCGGDGDAAPTVSPSPAPTGPVVTTLSDVTLYAGPGSDYEAVATLPEGSAVSLLGVARGRDCQNWVLVRPEDGEQGWTRPPLVNVDVDQSALVSLPTPTPAVAATAMPDTCNAGLALLQIENQIGKALEVYMAGPEPGFTLLVHDDTSQRLCLAPGEYCYDLSDGEKHETGYLFFVGGECTCWRWGGGPPAPDSCHCPDAPGSYQRP